MKINILQKSASSAKELFRSADFDNILKCVHCGLCLDNCPTYRELNDEKDSDKEAQRNIPLSSIIPRKTMNSLPYHH